MEPACLMVWISREGDDEYERELVRKDVDADSPEWADGIPQSACEWLEHHVRVSANALFAVGFKPVWPEPEWDSDGIEWLVRKGRVEYRIYGGVGP